MSFLAADGELKRLRRASTGREELSFLELSGLGAGVAACNTLATMPLDAVKTHLQVARG